MRGAIKILGAARPELVLLHVVESPAARVMGEDASDQETEQDRKRLEHLAEPLRQKGFTAVSYTHLTLPTNSRV